MACSFICHSLLRSFSQQVLKSQVTGKYLKSHVDPVSVDGRLVVRLYYGVIVHKPTNWQEWVFVLLLSVLEWN